MPTRRFTERLQPSDMVLVNNVPLLWYASDTGQVMVRMPGGKVRTKSDLEAAGYTVHLPMHFGTRGIV